MTGPRVQWAEGARKSNACGAPGHRKAHEFTHLKSPGCPGRKTSEQMNWFTVIGYSLLPEITPGTLQALFDSILLISACFTREN